jgi:hypothetical protein
MCFDGAADLIATIIMRRFSHWEYVDRRTFLGWRREFYPVYVEERDVFNIVIHCHVVQEDTELEGIERDTERMRALTRQLDAEAAMLDSYLLLARKRVELQGVLQLTHRQDTTEQPKLLSYRPQVPMTKVR